MKNRFDRFRRLTSGAIGLAAAVAVAAGCGGAGASPAVSPAGDVGSHAAGGQAPHAEPSAPAGKAEGTPLTDGVAVAFRDRFTQGQLGSAWNVFGAAGGKREVFTAPAGLLVRVVSAEKDWDAVGVRTSRVRVEGDFDLRGRFRDFSADGNGSAKLIIVDAASPRGEAAYVERIQIDGKNLLKFGGEVEGSLETWGFSPTDVKGGDLRLARQGGMMHAYFRAGETGPWTEFAPAQRVPKSMPQTVKFGVKLSAEKLKGAQVTWMEVAMDGAVVRKE